MGITINFSGINFEIGQPKKGLAISSQYARKYFHYLYDLGLHLVDQGNVDKTNFQHHTTFFSEEDFLKTCWKDYRLAYDKTLELLNQSIPLLSWGGDHSISIATLGAYTSKYPQGYTIWIDAHADINLPSHSLSGNLHGMPLSILMNINKLKNNSFDWISGELNPEKIIYIGLRDIDPPEQKTLESLKIKYFTNSDVEKKGMREIAREIFALTENSPLHISFDIDSVDPKIAPATGVPVKNGLSLDDLDILGHELFRKSDIKSIDIVEINPLIGTTRQIDRTFLVAFNFLKSIFSITDKGVLHECSDAHTHSRDYASA